MAKIMMRCLLLFGMLALVKPVYHLAKRNYLYLHDQKRWEEWKKSSHIAGPGDPIAWIKAEDAGVDYLVRFGMDSDTLLKSPGLSEMGMRPNERGLKVILAHRDSQFSQLGNLKIGSVIELESHGNRQIFKVKDMEILSPEKAESKMMESLSENRLALMTCYPFQYIGPAPERYIVWATPDQDDFQN